MEQMQKNVKLAAAAVAFLALGSSAALARHPCHDDALRYCNPVIPDHRLIQHCLQRNLYHLRPACRAEFR
jgi:hypothetical protein